ncbi:MAG: MFS transporter [Silvibacterium sp.]|jgi:predicted MFS family arabinose efflux permease
MLRGILPHRRDRALILPVIGAQLIVGTSLFLIPLFIEALRVHAALSAKAAGLLLSIELVVSALTTLSLSAWGHPHSARRWAISGGLLAVIGTVLALISPALPLLFVARLLAGIGAGVVGAEATSVLARGIDRERLIAIVTISSIVNAAVWLAVLPYLIDRIGYRAPYACLLLVCLTGTYLLSRLPSPPRRLSTQRQAPNSPIATPALLVVIAIFFTQLGQGAFWSLQETFGINAGFNGHAIGVILSVATLILILGAVGAAWAGDRFGRFTPLFALLAFNALSIALVSTIAVPWVYLAANALQSLTNLSSVIYQLAVAASLDRMGRAVAMGTALVTLGNGIGPGVGASIGAALGAASVGMFVLVLNTVALGLYGVVMLRRLRERRLSVSLP